VTEKAEKPLGPRRLDLGALTDEDFELCCALVILIEFRDARKTSNPDGGADVILPGGEARDYIRAWQCKRYTDSISWPKCKRSLDRAVSTYSVPHYTFVFARDLTSSQEKLFKQHLVGRHEGVRVDHWDHATVLAKLLASDQGQRIASFFYGDPVNDAQTFARALRAAGPLETGFDALQRVQAVAEFLSKHDPFFTYPISFRESDSAQAPEAWPGSIMAMEETDSGVTKRIEAVPRNPEALSRYTPGGTFSFPATEEGREALRSFEETLRFGGEVSLRNVDLQFEGLPPLFQALSPTSPPEEIVVTSKGERPSPWDARFKSDRTHAQIDIDLRPVEPPAGWNGALEGASGGLTARMLFRRSGAGGEMKIDWTYRQLRDNVRDQARAVALLEAIMSGENLIVEDRVGSRPTLSFDVDAATIPDFIPPLKRVLADLATIEEWTGRSFTLPENFPRDEVIAIAQAAYAIRTGESSMRFDHVWLEFPPARYAEIRPNLVGTPLRLRFAWGINVFGVNVELGVLDGVVERVHIAHEERVKADGGDLVRVRVEPADEESRRAVFQVLRSGDAAPSEP
jgi:hypothetical protein